MDISTLNEQKLIVEKFASTWRKYVKVEWTQEEDQLLTEIASKSRRKIIWSKVARQLNLDFHKREVRAGKQCKKRWVQVLQPLLKIVSNKEKDQVLQQNNKKHSLNNKNFLNESQKKTKKLNNHKINQKLECLQVELNQNKVEEEINTGIKQKNKSKIDLKVTKKPKFNDSSLNNLCYFLMKTQ